MQLAKQIRLHDSAVRDISMSSDNQEFIDAAKQWTEHDSTWRFIFSTRCSAERSNSSLQKQEKSVIVKETIASLIDLHLLMRGKYFFINGNSPWHTRVGDLAKNGGYTFVRAPLILSLDKQHNQFLLCSIKNAADKSCHNMYER